VRQAWRSRIVGQGEEAPDQLLANPANYRIHGKSQQDALNDVLDDIGWIQQVVVNQQNGHVIDGHLRIALAMRNHEATVPVLYVDLDDREEALALATIDPISAMAAYDKQKLDELLREVDTGSAAIQAMLAGLAEDAGLDYGKPEVAEDPGAQIDKAEELRAKWGTERGQLWEIPSAMVAGKCHRLLCGDSTSAEDVARLMGGERAVLMATDPPYGVDFEGAKYNPRAKEWAGIEGDKRQGADLRVWLEGCLRTWFPSMMPDAAFYVWVAAMEEGAAAVAAIRGSGLHIQSQIIWHKNVLVLGQADYQWKHENCWYAFWKGNKHRWFGGRDQTTVWDIKKLANQDYMHPMQKPTELYALPMRNHTNQGEVCAEPFSGSGSQLVAGEQEGRLVFANEIEPKYVAVALERLAGMGLQPRLT
jgi:DNA modification methylase